MKLRKLSLAAAASVAALGFAAANAGVVVYNEAGYSGAVEVDPLLTVDGAINILNGDLSKGQDDFFNGESFTDTGSFEVDPGVMPGGIFFDVDFAGGVPAGILNMMATFETSSMSQTFEITDAAGNLILESAMLMLDPGETVTFTIMGSVFESNGADAAYKITILGEAVPVPAAGVLFGTALVGGAIARRKRKTA
ncbi:PEP-CTERM sorting domain-containing protein [Parvularcula dongshanensis]|uniref:VPLPA-CTERM sorting domain-containing protein n=1 Tax=Parvularcula dongshanensis TaxID=1173995 RepID=A0A840I5Q2_9PROT|nr:PEP-CTERM sorting domain-containing protein [Parvularcula dongshanensis]MBB4659732.1 hypothetical protein [Parvularcula dongshanensis]